MDQDLISAYIAGLFDGEGCVQLNGLSSIMISITNSVLAPLELVKSIYGGRIYPLKKVKSSHKQLYRWHTSKRPIVRKFIHNLLPFSLIKIDHFRLALMFYNRERDENARVYVEAMKILNSGSKDAVEAVTSAITPLKIV